MNAALVNTLIEVDEALLAACVEEFEPELLFSLFDRRDELIERLRPPFDDIEPNHRDKLLSLDNQVITRLNELHERVSDKLSQLGKRHKAIDLYNSIR